MTRGSLCAWLGAALALVSGWLAAAAVARASDVALLPLGGRDRAAPVAAALRDALVRTGHRPVEEARVRDALTARGGEPTQLRDLTALGAELQADYVVGGSVRARGQDGYTLALRVVRVLSGRLEEAELDVNATTQGARLESIVRVMLSEDGIASAPVGFLEDPDAVLPSPGPAPEGGGQTTPPPGGGAGDDDDELTPEEREALRRAEDEERRRREEEERADAEAFGERREGQGRDGAREPRRRTGPRGPAQPYGENRALVSVGVGPAFLVARPSTENRRDPMGELVAQSGGAMAVVSLRGGYHLASVMRGLELRGGLDFYAGDVGGFAVGAGALLLFRPAPSLRLDLGPAAEIGVFHGLSGAEPTLFQMRAELVVTYSLAREVQLEAAPLSLTGWLGDPSALALGGNVRFTLRF